MKRGLVAACDDPSIFNFPVAEAARTTGRRREGTEDAYLGVRSKVWQDDDGRIGWPLGLFAQTGARRDGAPG